jgi:hypothetical protein
MALSSATKENIALKKLVGKAHTTNSLEAFAEPKTTGLSQSTSTIFADAVPATPSSTLPVPLYERDANNIVEYVRLVATSLSEGEKNGKRFAFKLSLPAAYQNSSGNAKKGNGVFDNDKDLHNTAGKLQLVPPSFGDAYEAKPYYGGAADQLADGDLIPLLDDRSWYLDYFNGIFYQDVPPGDGDHAKNPDFIEAFIYIGTMADTAITSNDLSTSSIGDLSDVDITTVAPNNNQILKWNGTKFIPSDDTGGTSFTADTSSMWDEGDVQNPNDPVENQIKELYPHGIIDGTLDTGMFAINLSAASINYADPNVTLHDVLEELSSMNAYTPSTKSSGNISDAYFEIYTDPNDDGGAECIRPKE